MKRDLGPVDHDRVSGPRKTKLSQLGQAGPEFDRMIGLPQGKEFGIEVCIPPKFVVVLEMLMI